MRGNRTPPWVWVLLALFILIVVFDTGKVLELISWFAQSFWDMFVEALREIGLLERLE